MTCFKSRAAKISVANLPPEFELAKLFQDVINPHPSWTTGTAACTWYGVECIEAKICNIKLERRPSSVLPFSGALRFEHLPRSLLELNIQSTDITGKVQLIDLPPKLHSLVLSGNKFYGSLDLVSLPNLIKWLSLNKNRFSGNICLSGLPAQIRRLLLDNNALTGAPDLTSLPSLIQEVSLHNNMFSGIIDLTQLPPSLRRLTLENNEELNAEVEKSRLPTFLNAYIEGNGAFMHRQNSLFTFLNTKICIAKHVP